MNLPFLLYKLSRKKAETFFLDQSQSRAKIQTMARKHTHSNKVQNFVVLISMYRSSYSLGNIFEDNSAALQNIQTKFFSPNRVEL